MFTLLSLSNLIRKDIFMIAKMIRRYFIIVSYKKGKKVKTLLLDFDSDDTFGINISDEDIKKRIYEISGDCDAEILTSCIIR